MSLGLLALITQFGCSPRTASETEKVTAATSVWSWANYPLEKAMPITRMEARVLAEFSNRFYAPGNGHVHLSVDRALQTLDRDKMWAVFSPETLSLNQQMLDARRSALKMRREMINQVDLPQKRLDIEKKLREAKKLKEMTARLGADPAAWQALAELVPEANLQGADRSPEVLDRTIEILSQQLAFLSVGNGGDASQELQVAEVELKQAEIELALKRSQYEMRMPFDGELVCNLDVREGMTDYPVMTGQLIGLARKQDSLTCEVRMQDSRWLALPADMLFLRVQLSDGTEIQLPFAGRRLREEMRMEVLNYVFTVPPASVPRLRQNVDSVLTADLCQRLEKPARIIPKAVLLTEYAAAFSSGDWAKGINQVWPGAKLRGVGGSVVAIEPPAGGN